MVGIIYLYIKTHNETGLKYLGMTRQDPHTYMGSGKRWKRHLKKHGNDVHTEILFQSTNLEDIKHRGLELSDRWNIVESDEFANLVPEQGSGGWINDQTGKKWKVKDSSKMGKSFRELSSSQREKIVERTRGRHNYQSKWNINTPWGQFYTWRDAVETAKRLRDNGRKDVVTDIATLRKYCSEDLVLNPKGRRTFPKWRGRSTREIGFDIQSR